MNAAEALVLGELTGVIICSGCLALWGPLPWGLDLPRPTWRRLFWLYPRSRRMKGIV